MSVIDLSQVRTANTPAKAAEINHISDGAIASAVSDLKARYVELMNGRNVAFKDLVEAAQGPLRSIQVAPGTPHPLAEKQNEVKAYEGQLAFLRDVLGAALTLKMLAEAPELNTHVDSFKDDLISVRKSIVTAFDRDPRSITQEEAMILSSIADLGNHLELLSKY